MGKKKTIPLKFDAYQALFEAGIADVKEDHIPLVVGRIYTGKAYVGNNPSHRKRYPADLKGMARIRFKVTHTYGNGWVTVTAITYVISASKMSDLLSGNTVKVPKQNGWRKGGVYKVRAEFINPAIRKRNAKHLDKKGWAQRSIKVISCHNSNATIKVV